MADEQAMMPIAATRREVAEQPEAVARVLAEQRAAVVELAATLAERSIRSIVLLGSGDSWFAGLACRLAFERYAGLPTEAIQAYEYAVYGHPSIDAQTAVFVISSSGRPTTTWDALDRALATPAFVIGITDNPAAGNPFHERVHRALLPQANKVGWPTQTTTATIALLIDVAIALGRARGHLAAEQAEQLAAQLRAVPAQMREILGQSEPIADGLANQLYESERRRVFTFVGAGPGIGVASVGMALLAEGPQEVGIAIAVEEFHHGLHIATVAEEDVVVLIAPGSSADQRFLDTARSVRAWGAYLVALVDQPDSPLGTYADTTFVLPALAEPISPLLMLPPLHQLSLSLAERKVRLGHQRPRTVP